MVYAPILIPTLCRYEHFVRCVESLQKNSWAKYTDIYIALDYPAKESHKEGYNKILKYLDSNKFLEFNQFTVIKRKRNYGSSYNMADLRTKILERYDRFIRTDDDCEFSPNFIEYMDKCLEKYEKDNSVLGVTGYSYPIPWNISEGCSAFKNSTIFPMWGTGFWKDKFLFMQEKIISGYLREKLFKGEIKRKNMTDARYLNIISESLNRNENSLLVKISDVACGCYIQLEKKYIITPRQSLVRNWGFDGTGVYCQNTVELNDIRPNARTYNFQTQKIDESTSFDLIVDESIDYDINRRMLNKFDSYSELLIMKTKLKSIIKRVIYKFIYKK